MDEKQIEQVKDNLNEIKEYAEKFPENAGWRWVVESVDKTLLIIEPEEEKVDEGFDAPKVAEKTPEPKPKVPLPPPSGTDPETEPEPEPEITEKMESDLIAGAVEEEELPTDGTTPKEE